MRSDHVAVALYTCQRADAGSRKVIAFAVVGKHNHTDVAMLLAEALLKTTIAACLNTFVHCSISKEPSYCFTGLPLPKACRSNDGEAVVKALVDSKSCPGPFKYYHVRSTATLWKTVLDLDISHEIVQVFRLKEYQITMKGYNHLTCCCVINGFETVFKLRPDIALADRTT